MNSPILMCLFPKIQPKGRQGDAQRRRARNAVCLVSGDTLTGQNESVRARPHARSSDRRPIARVWKIDRCAQTRGDKR